VRIFLCNEVVRDLDFAAQCRFARETGYDGLEIAPFTIAADPSAITGADVRALRGIAEGEGVAIAGLHWLLASPAGMSITDPDPAVAHRTLEVGRRLIDLCGELGGAYLVHGSPGQRTLRPGREAEGRRCGVAYFAAVAEAARMAGVAYIIEPLSRADTAFVNSLEEALAIVAEIGSPALATMIDCYAASSNGEDIPALLERWAPQGAVAHVHFNDDNKRGPGEGNIDFAAILDTLARLNYSGDAAIEPFVHLPDGPACAARAIGYLRGLAARAA
jgi:sugar phosphate isomerase/epimerase